MRVVMVMMLTHLVLSQSSQQAEPKEKISNSQNLQNIRDFLLEKLRSSKSSSNQSPRSQNSEDMTNTGRKSKTLPFYPFFPPPLIPYGPPPPPPGYYYPQDKEIVDNTYTNEWLSRTEPFKKNPSLIDSPTYYIRLPPNPYVFVPGMGYVSRPPSLSDPEVLENGKPEPSNQVGNDLLHDPFYRLPINFVSNGKPTSVYQLTDTQSLPKPDSNLINLDKGPYVFNGKPSEIFLIAQIYDALYGDELNHYYP